MVPSRPVRITPFVELLAKTNYSFLEGACHPEEMVVQAKALGYTALGVADRHGVYGGPRAHQAAKGAGFKLVLGAEISLGGQPAWLLARNRAGYGDLCELLTYTHTQGKDPVPLPPEQLWERARDLYCLLPARTPGGPLWSQNREAFGNRLAAVVTRFSDGSAPAETAAALALEKQGIPVVASQLPLYHLPERKSLQDVLTCIRHTCPLKDAGFRLLPNRDRHLAPLDRMHQRFHDAPHWLEHTVRIAEDCHFSLDEIRYHYPNEWLPEGLTAPAYLRQLVTQGCGARYPDGTPEAARRQLEHELQLIDELGYCDYFLTIWDIVQFARGRGILCQGRGSAANSAVCYVLGITAIDPTRMDLLFERFISRERDEPPDIDIDFEHERREEVIQYLYERYGRDRAAITAEVICFRRRSTLREVGKVFGIPTPTVERLLTLSHRRSLSEVTEEELTAAGPELPPTLWRQYLDHCRQISGYPRHLGTHVGGFVLCQEKLTRNVPVENAAMDKRSIVQWDKNDLDSLGFVRVDILGLGILTCLRKCFDLVKESRGIELTLATVPAEDPHVYDCIGTGDTVGVFQIESRAQMNMLPRLRPRNFYDLVVEISLVRPGPIQGDMVHPYLRRRSGREKVEYPHPDLEAILKKTYGVPIFQEQIMKIAMVVAGFTGGEADELRRAMGIWRRDGKNHLTRMGERFRKGLIDKGIPESFSERIFSQIEGFAEYGFPESHAASFAVIAYASSYLKIYYPDAYLVALLNSQPMGFYGTHSLVHDAQRHGVRVLGMDVNHSFWDNQLEQVGVARLGFREIKGLAKRVALAIEKCRLQGPFLCLEELVYRLQKEVPLTRRDLFLLAGANALESLKLTRRQALWEIQGLLLQQPEAFAPPEEPTLLPREGDWERIVLDYESQGVSLYQHPMSFLRQEHHLEGIVPSKEVATQRPKARIRVAGLVICRQMPETSSGVLFITLEDEFGFVNLVIWNTVYRKYRDVLITQSFLVCEGRVEFAQEGRVVHVIVESAESLLVTPRFRSHDWH